MCGIAAFLAASPQAPPVDAESLARVSASMAKRGPDGHGLWLSDHRRVGLAHRRLAILDLSEAGAQPMASADGRLAMVFNGEIYNFAQLRRELEQGGVRFRSQTDTEVILELYRRDGIAMLGRLRGMFAIALWDSERQGLLLARDPFGIKPFYVAEGGDGTLRAASQVKALLAGGGIDTSPDPAGHAGFFLWGHVPEPHTLYRGIRALPPGSWLWQGLDGERREGTFFDLSTELRQPRSVAGVDLKAALTDSVAYHMIADVPVGVFLSAGLDSTTLAALAARQSPHRLLTITLGFSEFEGRPQDEVPLAELAGHHFGTDHTTVRIHGHEFAARRDQILADMDQPSIDGVNVWFVARAAARAGLKVALSGLGGDELFGGYDNFRTIPRLVAALGTLGTVPALGRGFRWLTAPLARRLAKPKLAGILELGTSLSDAYLLRRGLFMPWELPEVMDTDMARAGLQSLAPRLRLAEAAAGMPDSQMALSALEMQFYMRNQLLRDADWAGMAHSLEIRVPLVDTALLGAVLALHAGGVMPTKRLMAACAEPALPSAILERPKTGFSVPVAHWLGETSLRGWARRVYSTFTMT